MPSLSLLFASPKRLGSFVRQPWVERHSGRLELVVTLETLGGITVEGMLLRGRTIKSRPDEDVTFQLEYRHDSNRNDNAIDRIDWKPLRGHNNRGNGPEYLRFKTQHGSHRHAFHLNWLERERRMRYSNLPIAEPVTQSLSSYSELLEYCEECFSIEHLGNLPPPPWERMLL